METNLAGKTYEVQTEQNGRWTLHASHNVKSQAIQQAQALLDSHKYSGVKVIAESPRKGEEIIFEEKAEVTDKGLTIVPIEESPVCADIADCYRLEARLTIGRLLRQYLDDAGMTAMELAFDFGRLSMLERDDKLYIGALSRLGQIQAKVTGEKPADRQGAIEGFYNQIKDCAQSAMKRSDLLETIRIDGLDALVSKVNAESPEAERHRTILAGLAAFLGEEGDWSAKAGAIIGLLVKEPGIVAQAYADEALAEIFDGAVAVGELLGGVADAAQAQRMLVQLCQGRLPEVKNALSCINELNKTFAKYDLGNAKNALLARVARGIGGIKPLTREGPEGERNAVVNLIRSLEGMSGLMGGPQMAEALTLRAKMALGGPDGDLSTDIAISKVMALLPSLPTRAGFILDLSSTPTGEKQQASLVRMLAQEMGGLNSRAALTGGGDDEKMAKQVVFGLTEKIEKSGLPPDLQKTASATLAKALLVGSAQPQPQKPAAPGQVPNGNRTQPAMEKRWESGPAPAGQAQPAQPAQAVPAAQPAQAAKRGGAEHRKLVKGQILFEEGDPGTEAFVVSSGTIEIYRRGAVEQRLATLGPGELLGELSLIDDQPRVASARAVENTDLIVLSKESLKARLQRLEQSDKVLSRLVDVLVNRLRGVARNDE